MGWKLLAGCALLSAAGAIPCAVPGAIAAPDVPTLLKQADAYRLPTESARVQTEVQLYKNGTLDKERLYTVYLKPGRRSLVLMKSPVEAGQKVLMLDDQFWLLMPESQRPLRITPSQKLLGEASTGDIANMTWSGDYAGILVAESPCPTPPAELPEATGSRGNKLCMQLDLAATRPGATYGRVVLYLEKPNALPVKADLLVGSGKRAREAWYLAGKADGRERVTGMWLLDDIQPNRRTRVHYRRMEAKEAPDEFFNPAALARSSLAGW